MPKTLLVAVFLAWFATLAGADDQQSNFPEAEAASEILDAYHQESRLSEHDKRILHLVYWTPSDREPADQYRERLSRVMRHIQSFYRDQMQQNGFGQRTFGLRDDADGLLKFHVVKGLAPFADYGKQSGSRIRDECVPYLRAARVDPSRETILIFCNMGQWDETTRRMTHNSPYYAGGDSVSGTAWQLDEPIMDTRNLVDQKPMRDGQYGRISMGKHNSIFIGGVAHELGHALGLPHHQERPEQRSEFGTALMGSGNRTYGEELRGEGKGSFLTLAHAMRLASHPQFSGSTRGMSDDVRATIGNMKFTAIDRGFRVTGTVSSEMPIYAVVAYTDPEAGGDYNATSQVAVPDWAGNFSMDCTALVDDKPGELRLVTCHVNGKTTIHAFGYSVNRDGAVDLSEINKRLALGPLVERLNAKDQASASDLTKKLPSGIAAIGKRLVESTREARL